MYNTNTIFEMIQNNIKVDRTLVMLAKKFLLQIQNRQIDVSVAEGEFLKQQGYSYPGTVNVNDSVFDVKEISRVASYISYSIAFSEAVLELINSNYLIASNQQRYSQNFRIRWTTIVGNSGGNSDSWNFTHYITEIPLHVKRPLSKDQQSFILYDADLYITELNILNANPEVISALKDTIECFKKELYSPSLTMLGKVVEGAWIEMGISLAKFAIKQNNDKEKNEQLIEFLMGLDGFAMKVEKIVNLYSSHHKDWFLNVRKNSGIQINQLLEIKVWTDVVREARNAIHFGSVPTTPNTFEKASTLLLAASKNLKTLYNLKLEADK